MRVVGLISGGKDSIFNLMQCKAQGHELVALANLYPDDEREEMDSYMYQTVGHVGIELIATALDLPLYRRKTKGVCVQDGSVYTPDQSDEVEDLYSLLEEVKVVEKVDAVASGAILSDYQRCRVENVCGRLQLTSLSYLWRRNQTELLQEMIDSGMEAIVIKVAALGLDPEKHLGKSIREIQGHMMKLKESFGVNVCGEGGEYETFTLDCPLFKYRIVVADKRIVTTSGDVGYIVFEKLALESKSPEEMKDLIPKNLSYKSYDYEDLATSEVIQRTQEEFEYPLKARSSSRNSVGWMWLPQIHGRGSCSKDGAEDAMEALRKMSEDLGNFTLRDIIAVNIFLKDMKDFAEINKIYSANFNFPNPPSRACVETNLPEGLWIILDVLVAVTADPSIPRDCIHVQGISHWAPSNIGPYSQGKLCGDIATISGQIGLIPGSMTLPPDGNFPTECKLSLRNADCVIRALDCHRSLRDVSYAICYLSHSNLIPRAMEQWQTLSSHAIVDYVVVPCLPRNAQIEWQVLLHSPESSQNSHKRDDSSHTSNGFTLNLQKLSSPNNFEIVSGTISSVNESYSENCSKSLEDLFQRILSNASLEEDNRATRCRIFSKDTHNGPTELFLELCQRKKLNYVLIPAKGLTDNGIATITFIKFANSTSEIKDL
ncbi:uncharacterized protein LOC129810065 [Phlebotomus papatasi]|uniref:uncharacterized protein LOC129810065 n=1 Tax=Phlebotomus papatasi TaxID=29031 RepID=UPI00248453ED|nr:uncharacterized protein LOC129810065 [Phlebotomus papatasi]